MNTKQKALDIPTKIEFQDFVKGMAVVHFRNTQFHDLLNGGKDGKRVMDRYIIIPQSHPENFDVMIVKSELDLENLDDEFVNLLPMNLNSSDGKLFYFSINISFNDGIADFFELIEFVGHSTSKDNLPSINELYIASTCVETDCE